MRKVQKNIMAHSTEWSGILLSLRTQYLKKSEFMIRIWKKKNSNTLYNNNYISSPSSKWLPCNRHSPRKMTCYYWNIDYRCTLYTDMLQDLDWESLESRRVKIQLTLLFKVTQDLVDIPAAAYLTPASTRARANHTKKLRQISSRSDAYKFSFFPRTIPVWNSLPATVAEAPDLVYS